MDACALAHVRRHVDAPHLLDLFAGWLLVIMATGGGPIAYLIGERLGAITFLEPTFIVLGLMATGWLVLMLFFHIFMGKHQ